MPEHMLAQHKEYFLIPSIDPESSRADYEIEWDLEDNDFIDIIKNPNYIKLTSISSTTLDGKCILISKNKKKFFRKVKNLININLTFLFVD